MARFITIMMKLLENFQSMTKRLSAPIRRKDREDDPGATGCLA